MQIYLISTTNVTTFELQWRDWFYLTPHMNFNEKYEDALYQLKLVQRAVDPPSGNTPGPVTNIQLGAILSLYHTLRFGSTTRVVGNNTYNRFTTALNALAGAYPEITSYMSAAAASETDFENTQQETGRKTLRGKYNV